MPAESSRAVFLSYGSQDGEAALRICESLRQAGIEVWFDQSELRGGDVWDQKIRRQIKECALFVPIISANTQARAEGYFRREWKLAVERTHDMADHVAFLVPVVIDETRDADAFVPENFRAVQWTRILAPERIGAFCACVQALLGGVQKQMETGRPRALRDASAEARTKSSNQKSIAVLAFANLSQDPENEYFSDGISEELLNVLAKVPGLRVTARTSSFYFKGKNLPVPRIAQELGVGYIVEGSVRRAGSRVRITAQLIDAVEDSHLWSETFDRELKDIFAIQDEIAGLIAQNLQLTLGAAVREPRAVDPEAYELCLQGRKNLLLLTEHALADAERLFTRALAADSGFAPAAAGLAQVSSSRLVMRGWAARFIVAELNETERRAREAVRLDPLLGDAHTVLGFVGLKRGALNEAAEAYARAIELGASSEHLLTSMLVQFRLRTGRPDRAVEEMERIHQLDPSSWMPASLHGWALMNGGRFVEASDAFVRAEKLGASTVTPAEHSVALAMLGRRDAAIRMARVALDPERKRAWSESFGVITDGIAAWGLAIAGALEEANAIIGRIVAGPPPSRWIAGFALLQLGEFDDACDLLIDTPQDCVGPLMAMIHDGEALRSDARCLRLIEQLGATAEFEIFKRVRRGEKLE